MTDRPLHSVVKRVASVEDLFSKSESKRIYSFSAFRETILKYFSLDEDVFYGVQGRNGEAS